MVGRTIFSLALLTVSVAVAAVPTTIQTVSRQKEFVSAASTIGPASANSQEAEIESMISITVSPVPTPETTTLATESPPAVPPAIEELTTESNEGSFTFAYNIGGDGVREFQKDPEDWVIGETATFEIPDAFIEGAPAEYADIYKSHRYGLVGSTWGYDLAIDTPGMYDCTLHYSEIYSEFFTAEPNRTFMVEITGDASEEVHEDEFDVMVELGGAEFTPFMKTFKRIAAVNTISIRETPSTGDAFLSGISCTYKSPVALQ